MNKPHLLTLLTTKARVIIVFPMVRSTGSPRETNRHRVLDAMLAFAGAELTHAQLSQHTGLAVGTVNSIVRELAAAGVVDTVPGAGRRGGTVRLGRGAGLVAGIDFGHSHLAVAIADMTGAIVAETKTIVDAGQDHEDGLALAQRMLDSLFTGHEDRRSLLRTVGVGLPAPFSHEVVLPSAIMPGWMGVDAQLLATKAFGVPAYVDNDANLGAIAEHRRGAGRGYSEMIYVKISSGVGAGLIVDNHIFRGADGMAGEIGHLTVDDQGPLCRCGSRGCLEAYTSTGAARELLATQLPDATFDDMIAAARQGNVPAVRVFEDAGLHLGWGLAAVTNLMNPGIVVVGGDMARAGDLLLDSARLGLRRHVLAGAAATPVVAASLGDRASLLGAVTLAIESTDLLAENG